MWIDTYGNEDPAKRSHSNIYFAELTHHPELARVSDEAREVRWFNSEHIPVDTLAFAHVEQAIRCWSEARDGEGTT